MRLSRFLLLSIAFFLVSILPARAAQRQTEPSPEQLESEAQQLLQDGQEAKAKALLGRALQAYQNTGRAEEWINAHKNFSKIYRDNLDEPAAAEAQLKMAIGYAGYFPGVQLSKAAWETLAWANVNLAYLYAYYLEKKNLALKYYNDAAWLFVNKAQKEDTEVAAYVYREIGNLYTQAGDYQAAKVILSKAERVALQYEDNDLAAQIICELGTLAFWFEGPQPAKKYFESGLSLRDIGPSSRALLLANQAKALNALGKYGQAFGAAREAKQAFEQAVRNPHLAYLQSNIPACLELMAESRMLQGNYQESEQLLFQAAGFYQNLDGQAATRKLAKCYYATGSMYLSWKQYEKGLAYHQKALKVLLPGIPLDDWRQNPAPGSLYAENTILDALSGKADILFSWFKQEGGLEKLRIALQCHELIFEVEQLLRRTYYYESSKLFNVEEARTRSAHAIGIALELWSATRDEQYKEAALAFAERSKSTLLLEAFYKSKAEAVAGVPLQTLQEEKRLQEEIARKEEALFGLRSTAREGEEARLLENELLALRQAYSDWAKGIETAYPSYYHLKYDVQTLTSAQIRNQLLGRDEAFMEYFVSEDKIYVFVITSDVFEILPLEKDFPMEQWVVNFRDAIEQFQFSASNRDSLCAAYNELGWALYQRLVAPVEAVDLPEHLSIVPSGVLGFLPFDALLTTAPPEGCNFAAYPYLVQRYDISYGYSATLQAALKERPTANHRFVGFAPAFHNGPFAELQYSAALLEAIRNIIDGEIFRDSSATVEALRANASQFGLFHFATHAEANTQEGDFSFIVFSDGKDGYDSLFVKDIYLLPLQAELAVLSACETSVGTVYQGEGIISLARAFLYAGANSVVTTLWSINDDANHALMKSFYGFLKAGYSKSEALRQAKLQQIKQGGRLNAHPAYWAAFAPIGNMRAVYSSSWKYLAFGLLGGALLLGFYVYRRRVGDGQNVS
ncbi:MAG: CHAT domain-containing protein [Phaeodactylibacter sp.]|nr:CHAT domain-containing protein [Phaeodactylibacter sp.]